jgi:hypothetical protein
LEVRHDENLAPRQQGLEGLLGFLARLAGLLGQGDKPKLPPYDPNPNPNPGYPQPPPPPEDPPTNPGYPAGNGNRGVWERSSKPQPRNAMAGGLPEGTSRRSRAKRATPKCPDADPFGHCAKFCQEKFATQAARNKCKAKIHTWNGPCHQCGPMSPLYQLSLQRYCPVIGNPYDYSRFREGGCRKVSANTCGV